jgi:hypothetical protein
VPADLVVIVPSRGRPGNARLLAQAFASLCTAGTRLVFAVDEDDPALPEYSDLPRAFPGTEALVSGPWQPMVAKLNTAAAWAAKQAFAVAFMGDDHRPRTPSWDTAMLASLRDLGTGVVYGDDLLQGERLCTSWAMTSDIVRALGRMVPAPVEHMYCDNSVMDVAKLAGCLQYLPDVVIEHVHPLAGKAEWDDGYRQVNRREQYRADELAYRRWLMDGRAADVAAVGALRTIRG